MYNNRRTERDAAAIHRRAEILDASKSKEEKLGFKHQILCNPLSFKSNCPVTKCCRMEFKCQPSSYAKV